MAALSYVLSPNGRSPQVGACLRTQSVSIAMRVLHFIFFAPGNLLADRLGARDEHERGLIRQLVNSLIWITLAAGVFMTAVALQS